MEEENNFPKISFKTKSKSFNFNTTFFKNKIQSSQIYNNILNIEDLSESKKSEKSSRYLLVKKINIKDKTNKYYSKAMTKIFNDVNKFLEQNYEGKKIIVGKECSSKGLKELKDYFFHKNKKRRTIRKNELKSSIIFFNQSLRAKNSKLYLDQTKNNSIETLNSIINKFPKKDYITKYPLSDNELKKIFQEGAEREKQSKNKKIEFFDESSRVNELNNNKKRNKVKSAKNIIKTERMNLNNMLHLQEKILKDNIIKDKINKKIINKLMSAVLKEKSKLLMNNKKELLIIKNKEENKEINNYKKSIKGDMVMKNWLSELRLNNKDKKKININKKEIIYYNKNINSSIDTNDKYNNININSNKLKIKRPSLFKKYKKKEKIYAYNKLKSISVDNADSKRLNNNNKNETMNPNLYNTLYIKGKNLLDHEIKISKELFGKKKKIIQYSYNPEEISNILFSKSKSLNNVTTPKAIINSIEIHNLGK